MNWTSFQFMLIFLSYLLLFVLNFGGGQDLLAFRSIRDQQRLNLEPWNSHIWKEYLKCTIYTDIHIMYNCYNDVIHLHERNLNSFYSKVGPMKARIGIVTYATSDILDYAIYGFAINIAYAINNDHYIRLLNKSNLEEFTTELDFYDFRWNKVKIVELAAERFTSKVFENWNQKVDYLMWIDADFIFLNMDMKVQELIGEFPSAHFFASAEHSGSSTLINSGSFIVKNSLWGRNFLRQWWSHSDRKLFSDQEQFDLLFSHLMNNASQASKKSISKERLVILNTNRINTDPPAMTKQTASNTVLHLMGEENNYRARVFRDGFLNLYQHLQSLLTSSVVKPLPWQLGLNQQYLLFTAIQEYFYEVEAIRSSYQIIFQRNEEILSSRIPLISLLQYHSYEDGRRLSNIIHHYCHAVEHVYSLPNAQELIDLYRTSFSTSASGSHSMDTAFPTLQEIKVLRKDVYFLLKHNFYYFAVKKGIPLPLPFPSMTSQLRPAPLLAPGKYSSDDLEMVKSIIIAGQNVLQDHFTLTLNEKISIIHDELIPFFHFLYPLIHEQQLSSLRLIEGNLYLEESLLFTSLQDYSKAFSSIEGALSILELIAKEMGEHILIPSLVVKGNILSLLTRSSAAMNCYERCLQIIQSFQSNESSNNSSLNQFQDYLIQIYYNYGISLINAESSIEVGIQADGGGVSRGTQKEKGKEFLQKALKLLQTEDPASLHSEHQTIYQKILQYL